MAQPFIVSIPHRLGRDEALRRFKSGLDKVRAKFGHYFVVQEETWIDNQLRFRIAALGQTASGTIEIFDDHVRLEVVLPWLLDQIARRAQKTIERQGTILIERK
jgi:hypothetical protein